MLRSGHFFGRLLATAVALTAPLVLLHGYSLYQQYVRAEAGAYRTVSDRAEEEAHQMAEFLTRTEKLLRVLAERSDLVSLDPQRCVDALGGLATIDPLYANLGVIDSNGALVCASNPPRPDQGRLSFAREGWFVAAMVSEGSRLSRSLDGPIARNPVSVLTVPLRNAAGRTVGVVGATIHLERLAEFLFGPGLPTGASVTLLDDRDIVITRFPDALKWMGRSPPASVQGARRARAQGPIIADGQDGISRVFASAPVGKYGLRVAAGVPSDFVFAAARAARVRSSLVGGAMLLLATGLALGFARSLARPLESLGRTARLWASGARGTRADEQLPGEFRALAREFNAMIDAREASETERVESERRYAAMLDGVDLLAVHVGLDGRLLYANDALSRLTGWTGAELQNGDWTQLVVPDGAPDVFMQLREAAAAGRSVPPRVDGLLVTREGRERRIRWASAPHRDASGHLIGITSIGEDVTDRHDADLARQASARAEAANQAKTDFLAHMSHELRTPLNAVLGFSQLLQYDAGPHLSATQRQHLNLIHLAGLQLRSLIDDVLDVSQIESGRLAINLEAIELPALVDDVLQMSGPNAQGAGIRLETDGALPRVTLRTDPLRLRQVLLNLVSNGIKYNRPGGHVRIAARLSGDVLAIQVSDDGLGMTADQLSQLFEPFNRLGRERGPVAGTGIGMSLSRQLARLLGGDITVDSALGRGTRATVAMKGVVTSAPAHGSPPPPPAPAPSGDPVGTVLYIEDNAANTLIVQELLAPWTGVRLLLAADGRSGLTLARNARPDLVLLDMRLPDLHGLEILAALHADPRTADIPVVSLSASAMPEEVDAARAAGATAYWTKPIDFGPFLKGVATLLARRTVAAPGA